MTQLEATELYSRGTETRPRFSFARANCLSLSEYARDQSPWGPRPRVAGVNLITVN